MNDLHLSAFAPRWRFLYAARFDAYSQSKRSDHTLTYNSIYRNNIVFINTIKIRIMSEVHIDITISGGIAIHRVSTDSRNLNVIYANCFAFMQCNVSGLISCNRICEDFTALIRNSIAWAIRNLGSCRHACGFGRNLLTGNGRSIRWCINSYTWRARL